MLLRVDVDDRADHTVVRAIGEVDAATSETLASAIFTALEQDRTPLIVDFSGVTFIDSTGLGLLIKAHREAESRAAVFAIVHPSTHTRKLIRVLGLDQLLRVHDTPEQALAGTP